MDVQVYGLWNDIYKTQSGSLHGFVLVPGAERRFMRPSYSNDVVCLVSSDVLGLALRKGERPVPSFARLLSSLRTWLCAGRCKEASG
jgi:hypothetical protein